MNSSSTISFLAASLLIIVIHVSGETEEDKALKVFFSGAMEYMNTHHPSQALQNSYGKFQSGNMMALDFSIELRNQLKGKNNANKDELAELVETLVEKIDTIHNENPNLGMTTTWFNVRTSKSCWTCFKHEEESTCGVIKEIYSMLRDEKKVEEVFKDDC